MFTSCRNSSVSMGRSLSLLRKQGVFVSRSNALSWVNATVVQSLVHASLLRCLRPSPLRTGACDICRLSALGTHLVRKFHCRRQSSVCFRSRLMRTTEGARSEFRSSLVAHRIRCGLHSQASYQEGAFGFLYQYQSSSGGMHHCHRCDPGFTPGKCNLLVMYFGAGAAEDPFVRMNLTP